MQSPSNSHVNLHSSNERFLPWVSWVSSSYINYSVRVSVSLQLICMKYWSQTFCASSLEASVYCFRADCCLVMAEWTVRVHTSTQTHIAAHLQSHWTQRQRKIPTSACASHLISWPGPLPPTSKLEDVFWRESLLLILLGVFITLPGTAQTRFPGTCILLPFTPLPHRLQERQYFYI